MKIPSMSTLSHAALATGSALSAASIRSNASIITCRRDGFSITPPRTDGTVVSPLRFTILASGSSIHTRNRSSSSATLYVCPSTSNVAVSAHADIVRKCSPKSVSSNTRTKYGSSRRNPVPSDTNPFTFDRVSL